LLVISANISLLLFGCSMAQQIQPELERKESSLYQHQNSPPLKSPTSFPGRTYTNQLSIQQQKHIFFPH